MAKRRRSYRDPSYVPEKYLKGGPVAVTVEQHSILDDVTPLSPRDVAIFDAEMQRRHEKWRKRNEK